MLHQIGVGALGPVFRTYEPNRDRLVAVKVFRLDITPEQSRSLADELSRTAEAGLFHPSIVEPLAAGVEGTLAYRADEYVAAESLDVAMRHYAPAEIGRVLAFITQLAGAIDFARAAGVGHGGLHPRDVFLTPDEARATGFGVVDALERLGLRAPVRRPYSAPERVAGDTWSTPADVFSLGVIAFELLTGRRPAGTGDQMGSLDGAAPGAHLNQVRDVLARAVHEDPAARYATALSFAAALEAAARETPIEASPSPPVAAAAVTQKARPPASTQEARPPAPTENVKPPAPTQEVELPAPVPHGLAVEPDDISAEREDDEAYSALSRAEQRESHEIGPAGASTFFDEARPGAQGSSDRLALDAADLALTGPSGDPWFADEPVELPLGSSAAQIPDLSADKDRDDAVKEELGGAPGSRATASAVEAAPASWHDLGPTPSASPMALMDRERSREEHGVESQRHSEGSRFVMLPLAVMLIVGLLLGFGAGYAVGSRSQESFQAADAGAADPSGALPPETVPSPGAAAGEQAAGREWSEGTVTTPERAAPGIVPDTAPDVAEPAAAVTPAGRIVVRSTPAGAGVTVNGTWRGRTPLTLTGLSWGDYNVRVVEPGYQVAQEKFRLSQANASRTMTVQLRRPAPARTPSPPRPTSTPRATAPPPSQTQRFTGSIFVDSRPRGAKVFISGKEYGTTPLTVPNINIGSHVVRLELPDHRAWTASVRVAAGEERRVTGSLEPIR